VLIPANTHLCAVDEIPDPGAIGVERAGGVDIIVTRNGDKIHAYENSCPHQGTPLETFPNRFFTGDRQHLLCSTHGARFRTEDGMCIHGPCKGVALRSIRIAVHLGKIRTI
jgi:nitrite reductase/ring-hydroxylating ferredoxin subunit